MDIIRYYFLPKKKARWESHKNAMSYTEQILEATSHKTAAVQPPTSHL